MIVPRTLLPLAFVSSLTVAACSGTPAGLEVHPGAEMDVSRASDAGPAEMDAGPRCLVHADRVTLSEGGRARVLMVRDNPDATLEIAEVPTGFRASLAGQPPVLFLRAPVAVEGVFAVRLSIACGGERGTASVDVTVRRLSFAAITPWDAAADEGPAAREHTLLWMDEMDQNRMLLLGGFLFDPRPYTVAADLWSLDLSTDRWTRLTPATEAPKRAGGRIATIPGERAILHFGGSDASDTIDGALTRFDYAPDRLVWSNVPTATTDGATLGALIYDEPRARTLSVCGFTGSAVTCDVREHHFATPQSPTTGWQTVSVADGPKPSGRYGFFYAHDTETDRVILFSGAQSPIRGDPVHPASDVWALELGEDPPRWALIETTGEQPPGRRNGCFALDPVGHRLFVFGGTADARTSAEGLWMLDLDRDHEAWSRLEVAGAPPSRSSGSAVYDQGRHRVLLGFGNDANATYTDIHALQL